MFKMILNNMQPSKFHNTAPWRRKGIGPWNVLFSISQERLHICKHLSNKMCWKLNDHSFDEKRKKGLALKITDPFAVTSFSSWDVYCLLGEGEKLQQSYNFYKYIYKHQSTFHTMPNLKIRSWLLYIIIPTNSHIHNMSNLLLKGSGKILRR